MMHGHLHGRLGFDDAILPVFHYARKVISLRPMLLVAAFRWL